MTNVVAIDAGTTSVRSMVFDSNGHQLASAQREFTQHFPAPGLVEHDADEIWAMTCATLAEVTAAIDEAPVAIGITNQRETAVAWDRPSSAPLHHAIVWQDRRTAARCAQLEADGALPLVRHQTGLVLDPYFTASKYEWLLTTGGVRTSADLALGTIDSWLIWKLTGGRSHVTDTTNASRTMLYDIRALAWSPELLDLFGLDAEHLPEVRPSSGDLGTTADTTALGAGVPITGVAGDQQAALFGQACFEPGASKNTYGTGSFLLMNVGPTCPDPVDGLLTTVAWTLDRGELATHYALEGAIFVTGAAVQWLRDGLGIIDEAAELESLARQCDDSGGVVLVPAFTGLGSPWWDPYARGTIIGITRGTGRPELARATVESMVHQTRDVVDAMATASGRTLTRLRVDGGASVMQLLLQLQADQLGVPVTRPVVQETTALGAAYLAGLAVGVWDDLDSIAANWAVDIEVEPGPGAAGADVAHEQWLRAVERSRAWAE